MATTPQQLDVGKMITESLKQFLGPEQVDFLTSPLVIFVDPLFLFAAAFFLAFGGLKWLSLLAVIGVVIEVIIFFIKKDNIDKYIKGIMTGKAVPNPQEGITIVKEFTSYLQNVSYANIAIAGVSLIAGFVNYISKASSPYSAYCGGGGGTKRRR